LPQPQIALNLSFFNAKDPLMPSAADLFDDIVIHHSKIEKKDAWHYPGDDELMGLGAPFAEHFRLMRIGIHHQRILPGRRVSWPHAERDEEEFVYVIEGEPDLWINGHIRRLSPGDGVGFRAGTGLAHTFINNTDKAVRLLVVGEAGRARSQIHYPLHPRRNAEIGASHWKDLPSGELGQHDGKPDKLR
jgi:uncharacterized cupin superfamily protein